MNANPNKNEQFLPEDLSEYNKYLRSRPPKEIKNERKQENKSIHQLQNIYNTYIHMKRIEVDY